MSRLLAAAVVGFAMVQVAPAHAVTFSTIENFAGSVVSAPNGVVVNSAGTMFGFSASSTGGDVAWKRTSDGTVTVIHNFTQNTGQSPNPDPVLDASGNLWGTTYDGGAGNGTGNRRFGTVFKIDTTTGAHSVIANFNGSNGQNPNQGLVQDASGNFYGMNSGLNASVFTRPTAANIFKIDASTNAVSTLYTFDLSLFRFPASNLVINSAGTLFGTTSGSGGPQIFSLSSAGTFTVLHSFAQNEVFSNGLAIDGTGAIFGSVFNTSDNTEKVYRLGADNIFSTLHTFAATQGGTNQAGSNQSPFLIDGRGTLFGTNLVDEGNGSVWSLTRAGVFSTLHSFTGGANGANPLGRLFADSSGTLYGTTQAGGEEDRGTIFTIAGAYDPVPEPASWAMLIAGFGLTGAMMRRRRHIAAAA
jgi:uncharacterized repeat protein (TIGR03803 family)